MSLNVEEKAFLGVALVVFGIAFGCIGFMLYLAYTKMDELRGHLKNCTAIKNQEFLLRAGPWGRVNMLGTIMGVVVTPKLYLRFGGASVEDLQKFPKNLKRKLVILYWTVWPCLITGCIMGAVVQFGWI